MKCCMCECVLLCQVLHATDRSALARCGQQWWGVGLQTCAAASAEAGCVFTAVDAHASCFKVLLAATVCLHHMPLVMDQR
jgi:hypothetical protein